MVYKHVFISFDSKDRTPLIKQNIVVALEKMWDTFTRVFHPRQEHWVFESQIVKVIMKITNNEIGFIPWTWFWIVKSQQEDGFSKESQLNKFI